MNIEAILKKYDLNVNSSEAEIKEAYRIRAMMFHPDKVHGNPKLESFASEQMKKLNADFDVIKSWLANNRSTNGARYSSGNTRNEWKAELAERDKRIKLLVDKALVCFKTGRDSDGFIYLHEALALNPYDLLAIHVLGTSYKIRGMYNDAYKTYNSAFQYYYSNKQYYDAEKKTDIIAAQLLQEVITILVLSGNQRKAVRKLFKIMEKIGDRETIKKTEKLIAEYYGPIDTKKGLIKAIITYIIAFTVFFAALSMLFMDNKNVLVSKEVRDKKGKVVKEAVYTSRLEQLEYQARITSPNNTWNLPTKIGYAMYYMANSKEYKLSIQISFVLGLIIIPLAYIFRGLSAAISASYLVLGLILFGQMITRLDVIIFGEGIAAIIAWLFWRKQMKAKRLKTRAA